MNIFNPIKGFTLAELLIALAILGVIATFAIPKILQAQADQHKKAVIKEIYSALSDGFYQGYSSGEMTETNVETYMTARLNYIRRCAQSETEGCWAGSSFSDSDFVGYLFSNGVAVVGFDNGLSGSYEEWVYLDWDGPANGNNAMGDDQISLRFAFRNHASQRPGTLTSGVSSSTLFQSIFQ